LPEATQVWVTGIDPRTGLPIQAVKARPSLEDPETPPSLRPDGWVGEPWPYGWIDTTIGAQDVLESCCETLYKRLTIPYYAAEITAELLRELSYDEEEEVWSLSELSVWRGKVIELDGHGLYRVMALACETRYEQETRYVLRRLPEDPEEEESVNGAGSRTSLKSLIQRASQLGFTRQRVMKRSEHLLGVPAQSVTRLP
jgi:hypothetical protein